MQLNKSDIVQMLILFAILFDYTIPVEKFNKRSECKFNSSVLLDRNKDEQ